jgi:small membrane protein
MNDHQLNDFQWIALSLLSGLLIWEVVWFLRGKLQRWPWIVRCCVWIAAAVAIAKPELTTKLARLIGIGSGANLVLYCFVLAGLMMAFYFYSRYVKLQRELTEVVRHIAVREAKRGGPGDA